MKFLFRFDWTLAARGGADPPSAEHLKPMLGEGFTTPDFVQGGKLL
jgi:hypothetical protein